MKNEIILWVSSILIVFIIGYIKNVTDKDYPITGTFGIEGKKVSYKLDKVSFDKSSYKNIVISDVNGITGKFILWSDDRATEFSFKEIDRGLECEISNLKPGQKIKYKIILSYANRTYEIPEKEFVSFTFWGNIPFSISILHFILLYGGLLMAVRSSLELFNNNKILKKYAIITCTLLVPLVIIIAPLRNSYKLGAINHYVPRVIDILQPELLLILFIWIAGTILIFNRKYVGVVTVFTVVATVFLFFFI
ncbi:MAG TPA: hypothetical protein VIY47_03790 [Ignavibacteriaceae bacterium]